MSNALCCDLNAYVFGGFTMVSLSTARAGAFSTITQYGPKFGKGDVGRCVSRSVKEECAEFISAAFVS